MKTNDIELAAKGELTERKQPSINTIRSRRVSWLLATVLGLATLWFSKITLLPLKTPNATGSVRDEPKEGNKLSPPLITKENYPKYRCPDQVPLYVISNPTAVHRRGHIERELASRGINFTWFDASTPDQELTDVDKYVARACGGAIQASNWELTECLTHFRLMHKMLAEGNRVQVVLADDSVVLLEEDEDFMLSIRHILEKLPADWEILYLHTVENGRDALYEDGSIRQGDDALFASAMGDGVYGLIKPDTSLKAIVYNNQFARNMLNTVGNMPSMSAAVKELTGHGNAYAVVPPLIGVEHLFPTKMPDRDSSNKYVVMVVGGDVSFVPFWLRQYDALATWDIVMLYYGDNPYFDCIECIAVQRKGGAKYNLVYQFLQTQFWREVQGRYSAVMITDDDLMMDVHSLNIAFKLFSEYDLKLAQQSVCRASNSFSLWDALFQRPEFVLRYTNWIEIMAPIFEGEFFNDVVNSTLATAWTGFGLDSVWPYLLGYPESEIAVIDAVCMAHPEQQPAVMAGRKRIYNQGLAPYNQFQEENMALNAYGLSKSEVVGKVHVHGALEMKSFLETRESADEILYYNYHRHPAHLELITILLEEPEYNSPLQVARKRKSQLWLAFGVVASMGVVGIGGVAVAAAIGYNESKRKYILLAKESQK